jgi:hypothetical protein
MSASIAITLEILDLVSSKSGERIVILYSSNVLDSTVCQGSFSLSCLALTGFSKVVAGIVTDQYILGTKIPITLSQSTPGTEPVF